MRAQTVEVRSARGRVLCSTVFRPCGKKLLPKGHVLRDEDIQLLETEGMSQIWVTQIDPTEVPEDDAVLEVAARIGCGSMEIRPAAGGRANLFALEECCLLVDDDLLRQFNSSASMVMATAPNFQFLRAGERVASIKSAPFAIARQELDDLIAALDERGPLLQARPIRDPSVGVLYSDPFAGQRARQLFETVMKQRLMKFGLEPGPSQVAVETEEAVASAITQLLHRRPSVIVVASTTVPAGPEDAVGRAMVRLGCRIERFLAPVEPGNLLLLGYLDDVPIVSAPGCFRSARNSIVDLILPPLLARYRVSGWEIACLGRGGLLS